MQIKKQANKINPSKQTNPTEPNMQTLIEATLAIICFTIVGMVTAIAFI